MRPVSSPPVIGMMLRGPRLLGPTNWLGLKVTVSTISSGPRFSVGAALRYSHGCGGTPAGLVMRTRRCASADGVTAETSYTRSVIVPAAAFSTRRATYVPELSQATSLAFGA